MGREVVLDGRLFCIGLTALTFYDPHSNTWTVEETELPWQDMAREAMTQGPIMYCRIHIVQAVLHQGRIVVFLSNGAVFERDTDGSWSRYEVAEGTGFRQYKHYGFAAASVLL